jgi:hypothetical protein
MHGLRQRPTPINRNRADRRHLRGDAGLCGVPHLEVLLTAATGYEALAANRPVSMEEERAVELCGEAGTSERNRLNEQESCTARRGISARPTNRLPDNRPLQLFEALQHCRVGKRSRRKERAVEAPIWATRVRHNGKDRVAKWHIG